ncbi:hypothetical protein PoB_004875200 [Plakobranchus ocellatus]|uniref:Uncharacterized protein n=1 Tax=Plakobranchus ocellatus TaxID=259542 RepID=A0AAV4BTB9_9GAST|nr:hypothetical protein PoB_004875200 [Plakobranchus ocellatus]
MSSSISVNSTTCAIAHCRTAFHAFLNMCILGSATGSRGTLLTFEKCFVKKSTSYRSKSFFSDYNQKLHARCVAFIAHISHELLNNSQLRNWAQVLAHSWPFFFPIDLVKFLYPTAQRVLLFAICDRFGLHVFTPCLLSHRNCLASSIAHLGEYLWICA